MLIAIGARREGGIATAAAAVSAAAAAAARRKLSIRVPTVVQHLPQLQELDLIQSQLDQVPAQLTSLTQLTRLSLGSNRIKSGWQHLMQQLAELNLDNCGLRRVPAHLAGLTQLTQLCLSRNPIVSGWKHLPPRLQELTLENCGLWRVPAQLAGLSQLKVLSLGNFKSRHSARNNLKGGWRHLPLQLTQLRVEDCGVWRVPAALAGRRLRVVGARPMAPGLASQNWHSPLGQVFLLAIIIAVTLVFLSFLVHITFRAACYIILAAFVYLSAMWFYFQYGVY